MKLENTLVPLTKVNSKWLKQLNIRQDKIKLLEENIGKTFSDINSTNVFLGQSPKTIEKKKKAKINKWNLIKLITFAEQRKVTIRKQKDYLCIGRKYLQMMQPTRTSFSKHTNIQNIHFNNQNQVQSKMCKRSKQVFLQRRHTNCQRAYVKIFNIANCQRNANDTTMMYHLTPVRMTIIKMSANHRCWRK